MSGQRITCPRCGQVNLPGATTCKNCSGALGDPPGDASAQTTFTKVEQERIDQIVRGKGRGTGSRPVAAVPAAEPVQTRQWSALGAVLALIGWAAVLAPAIWVVVQVSEYSEYRDLSAVQVTQVYTQGMLWVLVGIGVLLAGILWVVSTRE